MFGDFLQQFGLNFPLQAADVQGGLFGLNAPVPGDPSVGTAPPPMAAPGGGVGGAKAPLGANASAALPVTAPPPATAQQQPQQSPLASPLAPGQGQLGGLSQNEPAPAAGVGSQFSVGKVL